MSDDYSSPMRSMVSSAHGKEYEAIKNFNDAKTTENCVLIFEGDYGGQIYLTCPMKYVQCNEQILKQLLNDIDKLEWNDEEGCRMYYEIHKIGDDIIGGMTGGHVNDHLWIHDKINTEIKQQIQDVIDGKKEKIYI